MLPLSLATLELGTSYSTWDTSGHSVLSRAVSGRTRVCGLRTE